MFHASLFNFSVNELSQSLPGWGYPVMLLLMIIEGPVTTLIAAFLASLGIFNWAIVLVLSIAGDLICDIFLYAIGYFGGPQIANRIAKRLKIKNDMLERLEYRFEKSGAKIVFYVKAATGLSWITFILAGTAKMPLKKFVLYSFLGGIIWSSMLVGLGYFFGYAAGQIEQYIKFAGWAIFAIALLILIYITIIKKRLTNKLLKNNDKK